MSNQNIDDQPIDPDLGELLSLLKSVPARDPDAAQRGRAKYLSDVDTLLAAEKRSVFTWLAGIFSIKRNTGSRGVRFAYSALIALLAVIFVLLSGAGATAYAAKNALPGDALYQVKTGLEQAQMQLTSDAFHQAQLHLEFAERRLEEISGLIDEGRFGEIDRAAGEFEYHVQQAIHAMQVVSNGNPEQASQLATQITDALSRYNQMLSDMLDRIPEDIRSSVERAILTSRSAGEEPFGEVNENSSVNANINDGDDHLIENDNQNENVGGNSNGEDNDNALINENEANGNQNEGNENENLNNNQNSNHNENTNQNDNDSGNDNDHENSNDGSRNENNNDNRNENDHGGNGGEGNGDG